MPSSPASSVLVSSGEVTTSMFARISELNVMIEFLGSSCFSDLSLSLTRFQPADSLVQHEWSEWWDWSRASKRKRLRLSQLTSTERDGNSEDER